MCAFVTFCYLSNKYLWIDRLSSVKYSISFLVDQKVGLLTESLKSCKANNKRTINLDMKSFLTIITSLTLISISSPSVIPPANRTELEQNDLIPKADTLIFAHVVSKR